MTRMIQLFCLVMGLAVALAPVQAQDQDYSDGWSLDPAEDPLLDDDDDDGDGDGEGPTLYYRDVNTGEIEVYEGRDDSVSGITESKVQRTEVSTEVKAEVEEEDDGDWGKTHGKHRRTHSPRSSEEKPKTESRGSGGVGAASDDARKDDGDKDE